METEKHKQNARKKKHEIEGAERKLLIYEHLCREKQSTIAELATMFDVSQRTIQRDIVILESVLRLPIITRKGRYGGGIYIMQHLSYHDSYARSQELLLLMKLQSLTSGMLCSDEESLLEDMIRQKQGK